MKPSTKPNTSRTFSINGRLQNITDVSFTDIEELSVEIENIDYDNKRFVFEDIGVLRLGGILEPPETQVRIFSRVFRTSKGDVVFQNFLARSTIALINIQVSHIHNIV